MPASAGDCAGFRADWLRRRMRRWLAGRAAYEGEARAAWYLAGRIGVKRRAVSRSPFAGVQVVAEDTARAAQDLEGALAGGRFGGGEGLPVAVVVLADEAGEVV